MQFTETALKDGVGSILGYIYAVELWFLGWTLMSYLDQHQKSSIKTYLEMILNFNLISFVKKFWLNRSHIMNKFLKKWAILCIGAYRTIGTSFLGGCCRFEPSCSEYAMICFHKYSLNKAIKYSLIRLLKCRPFGPVGFDPVPGFDNMESLNNATK